MYQLNASSKGCECYQKGRDDKGSLPLDYGGPVDHPFELFAEAVLEGSVIDRFAAIAGRFAARLAIQDTAVSLTYAEFAALVDRIGAVTAAATDGRAGPVAILLPTDAYFPAAMLGVLAAGRAYVSLDVDYPIERNRLIISKAGACVVVTRGDFGLAASVLFPEGTPVIDIETVRGSAQSRPGVQSGPDDVASIVYTSGSSGAPKGVALSHRNLLQRARLYTNAFHISSADRALLLASASVSAANRSIYGALLNGASLHILRPRELGPTGLKEQIRARGITIYHSVPTLMRRLVETLPAGERLDTVRIVCLGGDRLRWSDVSDCKRSFARDVFLHTSLSGTEMGPCLHWFIDDALRSTTMQPPVGRPLPDRNVAIVDERGNAVADGEVGEIVVADRFVALGYWQDPELTARVFTTDPTDPALRAYKTGDLALRRPDGLIEYVGRKDQQIKLSGQRVELGEVESALASCRGVRDAAVVVRPNESAAPASLAAYCELEPGVTALSPRDLSAVLAEILPLFMVPRSITILDALPRLSNFKIDREELRRRDQLERERTSLRVEPSNKIQETLLKLWRDVLKRQDIGCDDDFFRCGGDSLAAVDLLHRIEKELQYRLPLAILPEAPTVNQLEAHLEARTLGPIDSMIRIHTAGRNRPLFAVCGLYGHALRLLPVLRSLGPDQPCYALQPPGMDWNSVGCATLPEIAAHYISEIKAVQPYGPYRLLGASFGGLVVFEMALQLQRMGEPVERLMMVDTYPPTCLVEGIANAWQSHLILDTHPRLPDSIEALNLRVAETHRRMTCNYLLDSRSDQNVFRGELTYLHCTGNPIVAGHERRRLWQRFASRFRLLQLPGIHGRFDREPQYTVLRNVLRGCLRGEPLTTSDPAIIYDRTYRIENRDRRERILSSTGDVYRIDQDRAQGCVDEVNIDAEKIQIVGWAVEPCRRQPAQTIAVFLGERFLGYGASGESDPDVTKRLAATSAQYAGFNFCFERSAAAGPMERPRLFVLSSDGCAAELRCSIEPVTIGSVVKLSNTEPLRVILSGNWSTREPCGVWSDGHRAAVIFDASSLPDCFTVAIEAHVFPPGPSPKQTVRIFDDNGYLLTTVSNERPNGDFAVNIKRSNAQPGKWTSLIFDIAAPTSPQDLGISADLRTLGIRLVSLAFRESRYCLRAYESTP